MYDLTLEMYDALSAVSLPLNLLDHVKEPASVWQWPYHHPRVTRVGGLYEDAARSQHSLNDASLEPNVLHAPHVHVLHALGEYALLVLNSILGDPEDTAVENDPLGGEPQGGDDADPKACQRRNILELRRVRASAGNCMRTENAYRHGNREPEHKGNRWPNERNAGQWPIVDELLISLLAARLCGRLRLSYRLNGL
jgi:hypothetical protein